MPILPGAAFVATVFVGLQAVSQLYIPNRISGASDLYGGIGVTVVALGWLFIVGRALSFAFSLNAALFDRFGSLSQAIFALPVVRVLPQRSAALRSYFGLDDEGRSRPATAWRWSTTRCPTATRCSPPSSRCTPCATTVCATPMSAMTACQNPPMNERLDGDRYAVADTERERFRTDGYVHLAGLLTEEEVDEIARTTTASFVERSRCRARTTATWPATTAATRPTTRSST